MELQRGESAAGLLLCHFVRGASQSSADLVMMIRRLTAQVLHGGFTSLITVVSNCSAETSCKGTNAPPSPQQSAGDEERMRLVGELAGLV